MTTQPTTDIQLPSERLEAYSIAIEFHRRLVPLARQRGLASLRDQLMRAADSVVLNLAEGAGRLARDDKRRFYEIALGSMMESAAVLDLLRNRQNISADEHREIRAVAVRLYQILSRLTGPPR